MLINYWDCPSNDYEEWDGGSRSYMTNYTICCRRVGL